MVVLKIKLITELNAIFFQFVRAHANAFNYCSSVSLLHYIFCLTFSSKFYFFKCLARRVWRQLHVATKLLIQLRLFILNSFWLCLTNRNKINAFKMTKASAVLSAGLKNIIELKPHVPFFIWLAIIALIFGIILLQNMRDLFVFPLSHFKCQMVRIMPTENVQNQTANKKNNSKMHARVCVFANNLRNSETKVDGWTHELNANEGKKSNNNNNRTTRKNSIKKLIIKWQTGKWYGDFYLIYIYKMRVI